MQKPGERARDAFREQAEACHSLGSPFMARLCALAAERLSAAEGQVGDRILRWPGDPSVAGDALPLRFAGALHASVLEGRAPRLARLYPPHDGKVDDAALWEAIAEVCRDDAAFVLDRLDGAPQTNEVRRSAMVFAGMSTIAEHFRRPLVLSELGASAGLNLHAERYSYRLAGRDLGELGSSVCLAPRWEGPPPPEAEVRVAARGGCDLHPLDPSSAADRLRVLSYIWADQAERVALTRAALDLAAGQRERVEKSDAIAWLERRLGGQVENRVHVVFHTIAWQYLPEESKKRGTALLRHAGGQASAERPLAWLRLEGDGAGPGAALTLTTWPEGEEKLIARADYHGRWVRWIGW